MNQALQRNGIAAATPTSIPSATLRSSASKLIGHSDAIQRIFDIVRRVANNDSPVLLKANLVWASTWSPARCMKQAAAATPLIRNCSAAPCRKTPSKRNSSARPPSSIAHLVGTIHLAEINQLPARIQAQLNTFLDEAQAKKGWGNGSSGADFRLVVSSTTSLEDAVKAGKFRVLVLQALRGSLRSHRCVSAAWTCARSSSISSKTLPPTALTPSPRPSTPGPSNSWKSRPAWQRQRAAQRH